MMYQFHPDINLQCRSFLGTRSSRKAVRDPNCEMSMSDDSILRPTTVHPFVSFRCSPCHARPFAANEVNRTSTACIDPSVVLHLCIHGIDNPSSGLSTQRYRRTDLTLI
jgi:hypothetical protein